LADDLRRFLNGEPVTARRAGVLERGLKWGRRHPARAVLAGVTACAAVALVAGGIWHNRQLREEVARTEAQQAIAVGQRDQARANLTLAVQSIRENFLLASQHPALQARGLEDLRKQLLRKGVPFCERLVRQAPGDAEVEALRGQAYLQLSWIEGETGSVAEAIELGEKARAIFGRLAKDHPGQPDYQIDLAAASNNLGIRFMRTSQPERAEQAFRDALGLYQRLPRGHADNPGKVAGIHNNLAGVYFEKRDYARALPSYETARDIVTPLANGPPVIAQHAHDLAVSHLGLARIHHNERRFPQAREGYDRAVGLFRQLNDSFPNVPRNEANLANAHFLRGNFHAGRQEGDKAEADFRRARELREVLARTPPRVPAFTYDLGLTYATLAFYHIAWPRNQYREALGWADRAVGVLGPLNVPGPWQGQARYQLALAHMIRAESLTKLGRRPESIPAWDQAVDCADDPAERASYRVKRALSLARLGRHHRAAQEAEELAGGKPGGTDLLDLARVYALAVKAVCPTGPPTPEAEALAARYAGRAAELLRRADQAGAFPDPAARRKFYKDPDLDALRPFPDFQRLERDGLEQR
jgi:tetratricopeptide (TPR) repeat protein